MNIEINKYCRVYRHHVLKLTLLELEKLTGTNLKTLSAFEHGRSSNIMHLLTYYEASNHIQRKEFIRGLYNVLEGGVYES